MRSFEIQPERPETFLDPEVGLPGDALLVRPSLWAAVGGVLQVLVPLLTTALPLAVYYVAFGRAPPGEDAAGHPRIERLAQVTQLVFEYGYVAVAAVLPALRILFTRYAVGPADLRVRHQLLERKEERVEWQKVTALRYRRTILDRLFGLERLEVIAYGRRGTTLSLVGLRNGSGLHQLVARKMRETASAAALFEND